MAIQKTNAEIEELTHGVVSMAIQDPVNQNRVTIYSTIEGQHYLVTWARKYEGAKDQYFHVIDSALLNEI